MRKQFSVFFFFYLKGREMGKGGKREKKALRVTRHFKCVKKFQYRLQQQKCVQTRNSSFFFIHLHTQQNACIEIKILFFHPHSSAPPPKNNNNTNLILQKHFPYVPSGKKKTTPPHVFFFTYISRHPQQKSQLLCTTTGRTVPK